MNVYARIFFELKEYSYLRKFAVNLRSSARKRITISPVHQFTTCYSGTVYEIKYLGILSSGTWVASVLVEMENRLGGRFSFVVR